jgi:ribonuclease J
VNVGRICIDSGNRTDVVEDLIIKDRRHLSEDGIVLAIIAINKLSGEVETSPEIVTRGFKVGEDGSWKAPSGSSKPRWPTPAKNKKATTA